VHQPRGRWGMQGEARRIVARRRVARDETNGDEAEPHERDEHRITRRTAAARHDAEPARRNAHDDSPEHDEVERLNPAARAEVCGTPALPMCVRPIWRVSFRFVGQRVRSHEKPHDQRGDPVCGKHREAGLRHQFLESARIAHGVGRRGLVLQVCDFARAGEDAVTNRAAIEHQPRPTYRVHRVMAAWAGMPTETPARYAVFRRAGGVGIEIGEPAIELLRIEPNARATIASVHRRTVRRLRSQRTAARQSGALKGRGWLHFD